MKVYESGNVKVLFDDFGNKAVIESVKILPYKDARRKDDAYRLWLMATYENDFIYHVSCYETLEGVYKALKNFSCNSFKEEVKR